MATYHPLDIVEDLDPLERSGKSSAIERWEHYRRLVTNNTRLIMVCNRGWVKFAVDVSDESQFIEFENQYKQGLFLVRDLYLVPTERLQ